jgi:ABC-2 type transport system permease protein
MVEVQTDLAKQAAPVLEELRVRLEERQRLLDGLRFLSPAMVVHMALEDVAGSGARRHQRFEAQVDGFHDAFRAHLFVHIKAGDRLNAAQIKAIPAFAFEEEPTGDRVTRVLLGVGGLLLAAGLLFAFALGGLRRIGRLAA